MTYLKEVAKGVLDANLKGRPAMLAAEASYRQLNWDSAFIALGLARHRWEKAVEEMRQLFQAEWNHVLTQPPLYALVILRLFRLAPDEKVGMSLLAEFYPRLLELHHYLYTFRDPAEEGLVHIRLPWEAGIDSTPYWEAALQRLPDRADASNPHNYLLGLLQHEEEQTRQFPFQIQDPLFNGLLAWSNEALVKIGHLLGEDVLEVILWNELTIHSMNEKLWNEDTGIYQAYDCISKEAIPLPIINGLLPLVGLVPTQEQAERLLRHLEGPVFRVKDPAFYACPSAEQGLIRMSTNWLLYQGLLRYDMFKPAEKIRRDSLDLLDRFGFCEFFSPQREADQSDQGAKRFSPSAAICLDLCMTADEEE